MSHLTDFPSLVFGWLKVSTCKRGSQQKRMLWIPQCVLLIENERTVQHFESEEAVRQAMEGRRFRRCRLDGGDFAFRRALTTSVIGHAPLLEPGSDLIGPKTSRGIRGAISEDGGLAWGKDRPGDCADGSSHSGSRWKVGPEGVIKRNIFRSKAKNIQKPEKRKSSGPVYLDIPSSGSDSFEAKPKEPARLKRSFSLNRLRSSQKGDRPGSPRTRASFRKETSSASAQPPRAHSHECLYSEGPNGSCGANDGPWERQPRFLYGPGPAAHCCASYGVERSATVRAVHPSLVQGQDFCFAVVGGDGEIARYYASNSEEERKRWIAALKRTAKPQLANERHFENSLRIVIQEVKNVSPKKSYFCEIRLDSCLNARTTAKSMSSSSSDMLFWGEEFEFHNLSSVRAITIQLRKDPGERKGKKGSGKKAAQLGGIQGLAQLIAQVSIPTGDIQKRAEVEKWYPAYPPSNNGASNDSTGEGTVPQIRIKARYLSVDVLPQKCYRALQEYLAKHSLFLLRQLEPVLNVKAKEELAGTLVNIHHKIRKVDDLLADLTAQEIEGPGDESMTFRGNSFATKAVECFLKMAGERYLENTLSDLVQAVMSLEREVEVDPVALGDSGANLQQNRATVRDLVTRFWHRILQSESNFPVELRKAFAAMRARLMDLGHRAPLCDQVISACVFLRYLCPAILNPVLFRLVREWPSDLRVNRAFTLLAKTIQVLANFSQFGRKEDYMTFLNDFVRDEGPHMRAFLRSISNVRRSDGGPLERGASQCPEDFIDLPFELAMAHQQLCLVLPNLPREAQSQRLIAQLFSILQQLSSVADKGGPYNDPCAPEANGRPPEEGLHDVQQLLQTLNIEQQTAKPPAHLYQPRQRRHQPGHQPDYQPLYQQPFPEAPEPRPKKRSTNQQPQPQPQPLQKGPAQQSSQRSPTEAKAQNSPTHRGPKSPGNQQRSPPQPQPQPQPQQERSPQKAAPREPSDPSPEGPASPVRRQHRNSYFVVPRASEEVVSILSTDSEGVVSPSRSSWGGEVGPGGPEQRRSSAHSAAAAFDALPARDRKNAAGSASSIPGVRMGTRSILRGVSSEKTVAEYEQEVRLLYDDNVALRQQLQEAQQRAQRNEEEARRLQAQLETQEALTRRLQAQLDAARQHTIAGYAPYGRRYIPASASSGSLHSLATPGVAPTSLNDLSSAGRARKGKQTMC